MRFLRSRLGMAACAGFLAACSAPNVFQVAEPYTGANVQRLFVATQRTVEEVTAERRVDIVNLFGNERHEKMNYATVDVSIPPTHQPGEIEWPRRVTGPADPQTDFAVVGGGLLRDVGAFRAAVAAEAERRDQDIFLFIHGFNTTVPEATYRLAQIVEDFDVPFPAVVFAWPSAGRTRAYVYDKDSALFARDDLVQLLRDLTRMPGRDVNILGHSMGTQLTMEALRQIALEGDKALLQRIDSVTLMSPDIDPDVFRRQVEVIDKDLPAPFHIFVTEQDRALRISSILTGGRGRLGDTLEPEDIDGLPITVVDFSKFADGRNFDHLVEVTSPEAIRVLRKMIENDELRQSGFGEFLKL